MPFDQIDDQRDREHGITHSLDLSVADHDSAQALQKAGDCLGGNSWRPEREVQKAQEADLRVVVHLEYRDGSRGFTRLDDLRFEQLVQLLVELRAIESVILQEKEEAFEGEHLTREPMRVIQACQEEISQEERLIEVGKDQLRQVGQGALDHFLLSRHLCQDQKPCLLVYTFELLRRHLSQTVNNLLFLIFLHIALFLRSVKEDGLQDFNAFIRQNGHRVHHDIVSFVQFQLIELALQRLQEKQTSI